METFGGAMMFAGNRHTPLRRLPVGCYLSARASGNADRGDGRREPVIGR